MITSTVIKKIFPEPCNEAYYKIKYDKEGLWSITHLKDADLISEKILSFDEITLNSSLIDMTAGCGGNLLSFLKYFNNITGIEIDETRYEMLVNNVNLYDINKKDIKLFNDSCINFLDKEYDVYFLDPPWGGPNYKSNDNLVLSLSDIPLIQILEKIGSFKLIVLKIPFNFDWCDIEKKFTVVDKIKLKNIIIVFLN